MQLIFLLLESGNYVDCSQVRLCRSLYLLFGLFNIVFGLTAGYYEVLLSCSDRECCKDYFVNRREREQT